MGLFVFMDFGRCYKYKWQNPSYTLLIVGVHFCIIKENIDFEYYQWQGGYDLSAISCIGKIGSALPINRHITKYIK